MGFFDSLSGLFGEPKAKVDPQVAQAQEAARHTVLVIDDDREFLEATTALLRDAGYNVLKCSNGPKGLNMLRYAPRDISAILLDFDMPQLDGAETLKFIRQIAPGARVAAVTGMAGNVLPAGFRDDLQCLLPKPFEGQQLLEFVRELINPTPESMPVAIEK